MKSLATFFKAAADPTRLRILRLLLAESLNVGEIQSIVGLAQSSVSKHLSALKGAGLVSESRDGGFACPSRVCEADRSANSVTIG